jgi:hypothetical protein
MFNKPASNYACFVPGATTISRTTFSRSVVDHYTAWLRAILLNFTILHIILVSIILLSFCCHSGKYHFAVILMSLCCHSAVILLSFCCRSAVTVLSFCCHAADCQSSDSCSINRPSFKCHSSKFSLVNFNMLLAILHRVIQVSFNIVCLILLIGILLYVIIFIFILLRVILIKRILGSFILMSSVLLSFFLMIGIRMTGIVLDVILPTHSHYFQFLDFQF